MFYTWNNRKYFGRNDVCKLLGCDNNDVLKAHNKLVKKGKLIEDTHYWVLGIKDEHEFKKQNVDSVFVPRLYLYNESATLPIVVEILKTKKGLYKWEGRQYYTHAHLVEWFGVLERTARNLKKFCSLEEKDYLILQDEEYTQVCTENSFIKSGHLIYLYPIQTFLQALYHFRPEIHRFLDMNGGEK